MTVTPFNPQTDATLDVAGLVKLQGMLEPEVTKFRQLRDSYRETCKPEEKPEVAEETTEDCADAVVSIVSEIRSALINNPEVALILADELKSLADDTKQVGKDFLVSQDREVQDGEGDEEKLAEFLLQRDRVGQIFKTFEALKMVFMEGSSIEELKKAGLKVKKNTKANAKVEWITDNPNDPSKSADEFAQSKAGRPANNVQTFVYEYVLDLDGNPEHLIKCGPEVSRFEMLLKASEEASSIYTWQDLHHAIKSSKQEIGADKFEVEMPNGAKITGIKTKKS